jgi:hypothetical protein
LQSRVSGLKGYHAYISGDFSFFKSKRAGVKTVSENRANHYCSHINQIKQVKKSNGG